MPNHSLLDNQYSYQLTPRKGTYEGKPLVAWAAIEDCTATPEVPDDHDLTDEQVMRLVTRRCRIQNLCEGAFRIERHYLHIFPISFDQMQNF